MAQDRRVMKVLQVSTSMSIYNSPVCPHCGSGGTYKYAGEVAYNDPREVHKCYDCCNAFVYDESQETKA